jgi:hypothetical protein
VWRHNRYNVTVKGCVPCRQRMRQGRVTFRTVRFLAIWQHILCSRSSFFWTFYTDWQTYYGRTGSTEKCYVWLIFFYISFIFYLLVLHPVAHLSNWFLMTPSIATKFQFVNSLFLFFIFTHHMFWPLQAIFRWDIQLHVSKDYSYYNGSAVRTQLDVCLYRYFDPWSPIHVMKLSIKVVKTLIFIVKLVSYIKYKNVKIQGE